MKSLIRSLLLAVVMTIIGPPLAMLVNASFIGGEAYASGHRHHHKHHHRRHAHTVAGDIHGIGVRFVRGHMICAINVSRWLAAHGFRSPHSASSKAFLKYARIARANVRFGDTRFNYRRGGGHVQIALGGGMCLNPSSRHQTWIVHSCPAGGIYLRTSI